MPKPYPNYPWFQGFEAVSRFEGELYDCIVEGTIPPEIDGTFYRTVPDPQFPPKEGFEDDVPMNGDGQIDAIRIEGGHVDFKQRYIRTQKFCIEREARRSVFGLYRNRYTDDIGVKHLVHSTGNTHVVYYNKMLLALKEDSPPYALDPDTLETLGLYTFGGQLKSRTFTAHPKFDPDTGEMITMGYEAKGDGTNDVCYMRFDKNGKKIEECFIKTPHCGMMHDFCVTKKYVVFHVLPLYCSLERLKKGGKHLAWDDSLPLYFGILPRENPKPSDIRWFHFKNAYIAHIGNAYDGPNGVIYYDSPLSYGNKFGALFPTDIPEAPKFDPMAPIKSHYVRWKLDPHAKSDYVEPIELADVDGEMPTVDPRIASLDYDYVFMACYDKSQIAEGGNAIWYLPLMTFVWVYNSCCKANVKTGEVDIWYAGDNIGVQEPVFIPRSGTCPEGDGYLIVFLNHFETMLSSLAILDTTNLSAGPVARILLPFRLRSGVHGSWVPAEKMPNGRQALCDMSGIDDEIKELVKKINQDNKPGVINDVNGLNAVHGTYEIKTEDQGLDPDLPCPANAIAGTTTKWGVGKLHHGF